MEQPNLQRDERPEARWNARRRGLTGQALMDALRVPRLSGRRAMVLVEASGRGARRRDQHPSSTLATPTLHTHFQVLGPRFWCH